MKKISITLAIILTTFTSCDNKFSEVRNLSEFKKTDFIPTMEHKINNKRNSVYCVTLLYAWDEIREKINLPLEIPEEYPDLTMLNASNSFVDALKSNEYTVSGNIDGDLITANAEFSKSLPFEIKLDDFKNRLVFDGQSVASFGITEYSDYQKREMVKIVYYKNDNNFIIKLLPKDKNNEIILFKTEQSFNSMAEMVNEIEKLTEIGKTEEKNEKLRWKYHYAGEDEVVIPKFNFNIETNYSTLEGNKFKTEKTSYLIERTWQRTAFILDESGAEIKSVVEMAAADAEPEDDETPKPKKMIFDSPFLILLKHTNAKNPYFGLWITNSELMIKE